MPTHPRIDNRAMAPCQFPMIFAKPGAPNNPAAAPIDKEPIMSPLANPCSFAGNQKLVMGPIATRTKAGAMPWSSRTANNA